MSSSPRRRGVAPAPYDRTQLPVYVEGRRFVIPVGGGTQSCRWVAQAALARFDAATRAEGAVRCRESSLSVPTEHYLGVASVTSEYDGGFLGPDITVASWQRQLDEALGTKASAEMAKGLRVHLLDRKGGPTPHSTGFVSPLWHSLAHHFSGPGRAHASSLLTVYKEEAARRAAEAAAQRERELEEQTKSLSRLLVSDADDPEVLEKNFIFDWSNVRVGSITSDPEVSRKLRRSTWAAYAGVCDLFRHFSGGSSKGSVASMQKQELTHMLVLAQSLDVVKDRKALDRLFERANGGRGADRTLHDDRDAESLSRYELLEFFILFADAKYAETEGNVVGSYARLLASLATLVGKLNAGPVRAALKEPSIQKFLMPRLPVLMRVYEYYASLDDDTHPHGHGAGAASSSSSSASSAAAAGRPGSAKGPGGVAAAGVAVGGGGAAGAGGGAGGRMNLMNLGEFVTALEHAGLLDDVAILSNAGMREAAAQQLKTGKASLTAQEVRETFSGVQREDDGSGADDQDEELAFGEFLEAIGRIAVAKWGDSVGLKWVTDPRLLRNASSLSGASVAEKDLLLKAERALVRALIMWAALALCDLAEKHLGLPPKAPVQYDTAELVRLISIGLADVTAAQSSRGLLRTPEMVEAERQEKERAAKAARNGGGGGGGGGEGEGGAPQAGPGVDLYAARHTPKAKQAFGHTRIAVEPPGRVLTELSIGLVGMAAVASVGGR
jgi:hypothetical protein